MMSMGCQFDSEPRVRGAAFLYVAYRLDGHLHFRKQPLPGAFERNEWSRLTCRLPIWQKQL
jgi:hypothetical protein